MNNVKNQLNKNRKSRDEHKHEWFTENNNRNSYQAYRDTILNYLYYKKAHSSGKTKHMYQRLFEILRNNPKKKAEIYLKILNEINNIPRKPNSDTYKEFLTFLDKLYAKYKKPEYENNFSTKLTNLIKKQKNNSNSNNIAIIPSENIKTSNKFNITTQKQQQKPPPSESLNESLNEYFKKIAKYPQNLMFINPKTVNMDNLLYFKNEGDMGSTVYFHPKQKYVFKFNKDESRLREEYKKYKEIYEKNLPVPKLIGFFDINSQIYNTPNKALVTEYGGESMHNKLHSNKKCKQIWLDNLKKTIRLFAENGYKQNDLSNLGNFIIDKEDNVLMIDIDSVIRIDPRGAESVVNLTYYTLLELIKSVCKEFI